MMEILGSAWDLLRSPEMTSERLIELVPGLKELPRRSVDRAVIEGPLVYTAFDLSASRLAHF